MLTLKQPDLNRLKEMCQPRVRTDKETRDREAMEAEKKKPKKEATEQEILNQQATISRLY